uniref:C2H2-type domain-containing protein n=1 Tax=Glossina pallidipes TaxID=7398 RepID=A0A1B0AHP7_GLOPL
MPLVTQLREGVHPLVFPTDLSIDKSVEKSLSSSAGNGLSAALKEITKSERKSPLKQHPLTSSPVSSKELNEQSCSSLVGVEKVEKNASVDGGSSSGGNVCSTLKHLTEEEATVLMLKAAAEKSAAAANNSGNLSDNSYSEDNIGANSSGNGGPGDYHPAFADVGNAAGLCNINILNSISAMNSLISGSGAGSNGGLGLSTSASGLGVIGGSPSGAGHPCPECGRVYKLKSSLRNHQKWECGKEPQFQCPFCVYRAKQKMHIGRHMERMHKEKFFKVEDLKSFATSATHTAGTSGPTGSVSSSGEETTTTTAVNEMHQHFSVELRESTLRFNVKHQGTEVADQV